MNWYIKSFKSTSGAYLGIVQDGRPVFFEKPSMGIRFESAESASEFIDGQIDEDLQTGLMISYEP